jgi:tetratricopeptide (TPR) repeat protein
MVSLAEFIDEFEAEDGRDLDWLVYEWLCRGDLPAYVLTYDVARKGDGYLIRGTIAQRGEIFRTPVPVTIDLGVWSYEEWVPVRSSEQSFEVLAELEPQAVTIDARYVVPRIEADELALVHFTLGAKAAEANEWGTAVDEFGAASELVPGNSEYAFRYGEALVHSGRLELGLAALEGAVEAAPDNVDARMELARLYLVSGRSAKALPHLERYVALRADDPAGHTARAMAFIASGRLGAAERSLDAASSLVDSVDVNDETLELLRLATGRYHEATGDTSSAAAAYREALTVNPVSDEARRALARLHED